MKIDKRFSRMLQDDGFSNKARVDRYGRKLPNRAARQELQKYYSLEADGDGSSNDDQEIEKELNRINKADHDDLPSSADESSSDDEEEISAAADEVFGLLDEPAANSEQVPMGEASSRIAVVNLDWDNIRATDLMVVFSSFVPSGGRIVRISIYPSDFGRERMEREETEGPPKEIFSRESYDQGEIGTPGSEDDLTDETAEQEKEAVIRRSLLREDKGEEFNSTELRRYQLERLRYYFAVLVCSSISVAQAIYDAVDGTEYLTTANFFDLRFVPDEVHFSADKPRDLCERIPDGYKPNDFVTSALQHSKVKLTWDADDGTRKEVQKRAFGGSRADIDENDLKAYIGSDSSDDGVPEAVVFDATADVPINTVIDDTAATQLRKKEAERQRMRALLGLSQETESKPKSRSTATEPVGDMQITFSSGFSGTSSGSVFVNEPERDETTAEKYIRKERERKNKRKKKTKSARNAGKCSVDVEEAVDIPGKEPEQTDLGFSDPFFTAPAANSKSLKDRKRAQRREKAAVEDPGTNSRREELESLLKDDVSGNVTHTQHFATIVLAKAEKLAAKKGAKKHRISARQKEALEAKAKDDFRINTQDPRFSAVFEKSEFAIDPSHKGFKETEGMKALLEEGRRKRRPSNQGVEAEIESREAKKRKKTNQKDKKRESLSSRY